MTRIENAFKNHKAFIAFVTGGDPTLDKSLEYILELERGGADLIEIGIPFSDPVAEGEVIQAANMRALSAGSTTVKMFELVEKVRAKSQIPLVFLTYLNPVFMYGYESFFADCARTGVDGIIIPDLPTEEKGEVEPFAIKHGVDLITLIAPTSKKRIPYVVANATGFVYCVSSMGVTGVRSELDADLSQMIKEVRNATNIPVAVGFGVATPQQAEYIAQYADGVIVGSAIVRIIEQYGQQAGSHLYEYAKSIKEAIK